MFRNFTRKKYNNQIRNSDKTKKELFSSKLNNNFVVNKSKTPHSVFPYTNKYKNNYFLYTICNFSDCIICLCFTYIEA